MSTITFKGSVENKGIIGDNGYLVQNIHSDFERASYGISNEKSLDAETVQKLIALLLKAEEAIHSKDEAQQEKAKSDFRKFWENIGEKARVIHPILKECAAVFNFFKTIIS